ncbi:MAG: hydrolase [Rhodospirillales bacterium]|nr:hydrolase [Rhodospirillales bacterium]
MSAEQTVELKTAPDAPRARILSRGSAPSIAYHRRAGKNPGVLFLAGFMSDMLGSKAMALDEFCAARGQAYVRFDYRGHGQSDGAFEDADIGSWFADVLDVFDNLTEGPQIVVGSSMGGWMMLLLAKTRPERVKALIGIAAAPDFTERLEAAMTPEHRAEMDTAGRVVMPSAYSRDYVFTRGLLASGRFHRLLEQKIPFDGPVRLLQGMADHAVPWETALRIQSALTSQDVEVTLIKDGDHRLSEPADLRRLTDVLATLLDR